MLFYLFRTFLLNFFRKLNLSNLLLKFHNTTTYLNVLRTPKVKLITSKHGLVERRSFAIFSLFGNFSVAFKWTGIMLRKPYFRLIRSLSLIIHSLQQSTRCTACNICSLSTQPKKKKVYKDIFWMAWNFMLFSLTNLCYLMDKRQTLIKTKY